MEDRSGPCDDSPRTLLAGIRNPDAAFAGRLRMMSHVVPFSIAFLPIGLLVVQILLSAALGADAPATLAVARVCGLVAACVVVPMVVAFVGLRLLRAYVALRLRRG